MGLETVHGNYVAAVTQINLERFWGPLNNQEGPAVRGCERPGYTAMSDVHIAGISKAARKGC